jgi:hypothetical protein
LSNINNDIYLRFDLSRISSNDIINSLSNKINIEKFKEKNDTTLYIDIFYDVSYDNSGFDNLQSKIIQDVIQPDIAHLKILYDIIPVINFIPKHGYTDVLINLGL